ncbi:MAG: immune inhibitor A, partial [Saprospiraceae bacterium]|nr:immune inhibitor A [Saprospiraceae bacterium]
AIALCLPFLMIGQTQERVSMVEVILEGKSIVDLAKLGLETDHGFYREGSYLINTFSASELASIKDAGFDYKIIDEDVVASFNKRIAAQRSGECDSYGGVRNYTTPDNFKLGSMGGYFTYQEMLDNLDAMANQFPDLITQRAQIGNFLTHDNNPIYWLRISDNANTDEPEKEVLYTALHHAREPGSLSQLIFFMWYLLENYDTDANVKDLVDNTELYFVPCLNPDGYLYNEFTNPDGGGFWRKNRRDNQDGTFGVDLNRNYGFGWGHDDSGSSPNTDGQTYREPGPFSEPETQAIKYLCEQHEFYAALNYHTYGNLLIYPWGYLDAKCPDSTEFTQIANAMTLQNSFTAGVGTETVGYVVNGDSDDWMYGEQGTKPKIYSMTPEVGESFWPDSNLIISLCRRTVWTNLVNANQVHTLGLVAVNPELIIRDDNQYINYSLSRVGAESGPIEVTFHELSGNLIQLDGSKTYNLMPTEVKEDTVFFQVKPGLPTGSILRFEQVVDNDGIIWRDTFERIYLGQASPAYEDKADNIDNWFTAADGGWGLDSSLYYSASASFGDSPNERYGREEFKFLILADPIDLTGLEKAFITFRATWDIEPGYDFAQVMASVDGTNFQPLCGRFTVNGTEDQDLDQPLYDGYQPEWVEELIDLSDYIQYGQVYIQFIFQSDRFSHGEGFNFDDFRVFTIEETSGLGAIAEQNPLFTIAPNPSTGLIEVQLKNYKSNSSVMPLKVYNALGKLVLLQNWEVNQDQTITLDLTDQPPGVYFIQLDNEKIQKVVLQK